MSRSDSFNDIVAQYSPQLLSFIKSRVRCREDAEDILQEVFLQLARTNDTDYKIERISSWLYRVAHNLVANFWNKKRELSLSSLFNDEDDICENFAEALASSSNDDPETKYLRKLIWEELDNALAELPTEQCEMFCLTVFDGLSVKNISSTTGVPVATLLSRKHYAVKYLRKRFHELYYALITNN